MNPFSCIFTSGKKKREKGEGKINKFQIICAKVTGYYKEFSSINSELKEMFEHRAIITNKTKEKRWSFQED